MGATGEERNRALQTPLSHSTTQHPCTTYLNAKWFSRSLRLPSYSSPASSSLWLTTCGGHITGLVGPWPQTIWALGLCHYLIVWHGVLASHWCLSLSSTVSPTKQYLCLWSYAKAYFCSLLGILTPSQHSLMVQLKHLIKPIQSSKVTLPFYWCSKHVWMN